MQRDRGQRPTLGRQGIEDAHLRLPGPLNRSALLDSNNKTKHPRTDLKGRWNVLQKQIFRLSAQTRLTSGYGPTLPTAAAPAEHGLLWSQSTSRDSALEDEVHRACFLQIPYRHSDPCTYLQQKLKQRPRTHISQGFSQMSMCMFCGAP